MIPDSLNIFVATQPIDLRAGIERLLGYAREVSGFEPSTSTMFVFFGRRRDSVKVVFLDATGRCLFHKRLHRGTFAQLTAIHPADTYLELDSAALQDLFDGFALQPQSASGKRSIH